MIRIVIVEDLPLVLEGLKVLINQIDDFTIVGEYANGKLFVDDLAKINADIVLTDINMPVMDGITATNIAMGLKPELKIIALSMYNDRKYYYEMVTAGAKGFVLKQSHVNELEAAIKAVYQGELFFSPELLRGVILDIQKIESKLIDEKKEYLKLGEKEMGFLRLICQGLTNKELSDKLFVSVRTIESMKSKLMLKTNTKNNAGLIIWAIKNKIISI